LLLDHINTWNRQHHKTRAGRQPLDARIANYELASGCRRRPKLLDLSGKPARSRELYGADTGPSARFGKMCLMARRMVERGVLYVQLINVTGTPTAIARNHESQARKVDQPIAGLLTDLERRGMLESTRWSGRRVAVRDTAGVQRPRPPPLWL